jgi:hypothetical protein
MVSGPWTYTAVLTGYPYFFAEVYRRLGTADFDADYWPAGGTSNQERNETAYPNAAPTTVADAYVQMSFGQNGFGGPMALLRDELYIGLVTGVGVGSSDLIVDFTAMLHSGHEERWAFETRTNNQTLGVNGVVWAWNPTNPFMTGTAKIYAPTGVISHISTFTGADNRNNVGTTGTLSLIAPGIIASFGITGQAPPRTLDQHMDSLITTAREMFTLNLTFTPEPTQFALLGSGVIALLGLGWLRRR